MCTQMFTTALFIIAKNGNNSNGYWLIVDQYNVVYSYIRILFENRRKWCADTMNTWINLNYAE